MEDSINRNKDDDDYVDDNILSSEYNQSAGKISEVSNSNREASSNREFDDVSDKLDILEIKKLKLDREFKDSPFYDSNLNVKKAKKSRKETRESKEINRDRSDDILKLSYKK